MDDVHGLPDHSEALLKDCDHSLRRRNFDVSISNVKIESKFFTFQVGVSHTELYFVHYGL
jgi:hypothetical protein